MVLILNLYGGRRHNNITGVNPVYIFNEASHEYFAVNYLSYIKDIIGRVAPDLDAGMAKWGSLTETEAFNQLSSERQDEIITYLIANNLYYYV